MVFWDSGRKKSLLVSHGYIKSQVYHYIVEYVLIVTDLFSFRSLSGVLCQLSNCLMWMGMMTDSFLQVLQTFLFWPLCLLCQARSQKLCAFDKEVDHFLLSPQLTWLQVNKMEIICRKYSSPLYKHHSPVRETASWQAQTEPGIVPPHFQRELASQMTFRRTVPLFSR